MGTLILAIPHQFNFAGNIFLQEFSTELAAALLLAGLSMLIVQVFNPPRPLALLVRTLTALLLLVFAMGLILTQIILIGIFLSCLGLIILVLPYLNLQAECTALAEPDLYTAATGLGCLATAIFLLSPLSTGITYHYRLLGGEKNLFGWVFLLGGAALLFFETRRPPGNYPSRPNWITRGAILLSSLVMLLRTPVERIWIPTFFFLLTGFGLLVLPYLTRNTHAQITSIRSRLGLSFAIASSLPLILTVTLISRQEENLARFEALKDQQHQAESTAQALSQSINLYSATLRTAARHPGLTSLDPARQQQLLEAYAQEFPAAQSFSLFGPSGTLRASSGESIFSTSIQELSLYQKHWSQGWPAGDILPSPDHQQAVFLFGVPILQDGQIQGLLTIEISDTALAESIEQMSPRSNSEIYLVNGEGLLITHTQDGARIPFSDFSDQAPIRTAQAAQPSPENSSQRVVSGSLRYTRGEQFWLAGYALVPKTDLILVTSQPEANILIPVNSGRELALIILLVFLLLTILVGLYLARLLTGPILSLANSMDHFNASTYNDPIPASSTNIAEVNRLGNAFEEMRFRLEQEVRQRDLAQQQIRQANEDLEEHIRTRTTALELVNHRLEAVLQALPAGIRIVDVKGRVIESNRRFTELWGDSPDSQELTKGHRSIKAWQASNGQPLQPEDWPLAYTLRTNQPSSLEQIDLECADGSRITILSGSAPVVDQKGEILGAVEFALDITRLSQLERQVMEAIREARRKAVETEGVFNALSDAVLAYNDQGAIYMANSYAIAMFGFDPLHFRREILAERLAPTNDEGQRISLEDMPASRAFGGEFLVNHHMAFINVRGRSYTALVTASPILIRGEMSGVVEVWHDITQQERLMRQLSTEQAQLKTLTERLERSNQDLEQFAFVASHDLQEPLRKVNFFGERLKATLSESLSEQETLFVDRMLAASRRMQNMIQDLLTYSRITTKAQPFEEVDLSAVVQEVLTDLEVRVIRSQAEVEVAELPIIEADPLQMQQLFQNLVNNALKFHQSGIPPRVRIFSRPGPPGSVDLCVEDNGIGFKIQNLNRMLQPFERLHGRNEYEGNGMGLAICHKIAERHHGKILAESEPGRGSLFIIRLPVYQEKEKKQIPV